MKSTSRPAKQSLLRPGRPRRHPLPGAPQAGLVLAFAHERAQCAQALADCEAWRDAIASLDSDIEELRGELIAFEARFSEALAKEHALEARVLSYVRHLERLQRIAQQRALHPDGQAQHKFVCEQRRNELLRWHALRLAQLQAERAAVAEHSATAAPDAAGGSATGFANDASAPHAGAQGDWATQDAEQAAARERAKAAYRTLARRYHPDLAHDEAQRRLHSEHMTQVNALYAERDWQRLEALASRLQRSERAASQEEDSPDEDAACSWPQRLDQAHRQAYRFQTAYDTLQQELAELTSSDVAALHGEVMRATHVRARRDPFAPLRAAAQQRVRDGLMQIPIAFAALEHAVHASRPTALPARRQTTTVGHVFDASGQHPFCKLSLQALAAQRVPKGAAAVAEELAELCARDPSLMRLVLFAYVAQLSPQALETVSTFDALSIRYAAACSRDANPPPLQEALVQADGLVAVRLNTSAQQGYELRLGLREQQVTQAMPVLLRDVRARGLFADVLATLGDSMHCAPCRNDVLAVPLFWLRGLDALRACVCPCCGGGLRRYVLARGDDVQALLNRAYLDFELVHEVTLALGRRPIGLQMLAQQAHGFTAKHACERLATDLFARNGLRISASSLKLWHAGHVLPGSAVLALLPNAPLHLQVGGKWAHNEQALCDELAYRVHTRYRPRVS